MKRARARQGAVKYNGTQALREAAAKLGKEGGGVCIACGHGFDGYAWYGWEKKHPEKGSVKLDTPPLPEGVFSKPGSTSPSQATRSPKRSTPIWWRTASTSTAPAPSR